MMTAVNMVLPGAQPYKAFMREAVRALAHQQPGHRFILLDNDPLTEPLFPTNVTVQQVSNTGSYLLSREWWYEVTVPALLKKTGADVFLATDGYSFRAKVPQCLVVSDLRYLKFPETFHKSDLFFQKRLWPRSFHAARCIGTFSAATKESIIKNFKIQEEKIEVIPTAVSHRYRRLETDEASAVKEKYAGGTEYFLCPYPIPKPVALNLLKAFSLFKKRQKSNMKLLIYGSAKADLMQLLSSYRYRTDVVVTGIADEKEQPALLASAFAVLDPLPAHAPWGLSFTAMYCGVPVLTADGTEYPGNVLSFDTQLVRSIAAQLMLVYKDEALRTRLVQTAPAEEYPWSKTVNALWALVQKALNN